MESYIFPFSQILVNLFHRQLFDVAQKYEVKQLLFPFYAYKIPDIPMLAMSCYYIFIMDGFYGREVFCLPTEVSLSFSRGQILEASTSFSGSYIDPPSVLVCRSQSRRSLYLWNVMRGYCQAVTLEVVLFFSHSDSSFPRLVFW